MTTPKLTLIATNKQLATTKYQKLSLGIHLNNGRYVPPGAIITTQSAADNLPAVSRQKRAKIESNSLPHHKYLRLIVTKPEPDCLAV